MKINSSVLPVSWIRLFCILGAIYAIVSLGYIFVETGKPPGSRDFHQFWYAGHYIIQGSDPYAAYFAEHPPELPIHYLDGVTQTRYPVAQHDLVIIPSNTPLMILMLTPFSYFSWNAAKWMFLAVNLIVMFVTGWLVLRRLPFAGVKLTRLEELFIFLLYVDFSATRIAVENGQTTLPVFLLMLIAVLYAKRSWQIAGLALGMALSKYSLSLPIFLFFIYKRNFRILFVAVAVQLLGILGVAAIAGTSPVLIVQENLRLFFELFDQPGIHLARLFEGFTDNKLLTEIPVILMTLLVFVPLFLWLRKYKPVNAAMGEVVDVHLLTILFTWTMLVAYHRLYDTLILIVFVILVFKGLAYPNIWNLSNRGRLALLGYMALIPVILILPARIVDRFIPEYYGTISDAVTTVFFVGMLTISMLLLRRFLQNLQMQSIHDPADPYDARSRTQTRGHGSLITN